MKKLILMLLVLVGGVMQASADDTYSIIGTINSTNGSDWDTDWDLTSTDGNIYTGTFTKTVTTETTYRYKVRKNHAWAGGDFPSTDQEVTIPAGTYDLFFEANVTYGLVSCRFVSSVDLYGSFSAWGAAGLLTRTGVGTYTGTLDLSTTASDQKFKLVIGGNDWKYYGDPNLTLTDNGLVSGESEGDLNCILLNSTAEYKTYNVTAVWTPSSNTAAGWTLTIAGKDARTSDEYSVSFVKVRDWKNVYAYAYSTLGGVANNKDEVSAWPGTAITKSGTYNADNGLTYDVYTYTFNSTFLPTNIIFDDNTYQTADFDFTNEHQYANEVPNVVYAAIGANDEAWNQETSSALFFSGYWDSEHTTDFMTLGADGRTYFINFKNKELSAGTTIYTKVIDKATTSATTDIHWYPSDANKSWTITENGQYDVTITIDPQYFDSDVNYINPYNQNAVTISATLVAIPATIGSTGYATFSSLSHDLDFSSVTGLTAYRAESATNGVVKMTKITGSVPASTGLFLAGESAYIPVTTGATSVGDNLLVAGTDAGVAASTTNSYNYVFAKKKSGDLGFYLVDTAVTSDMTGKAYLHSTESLVSNAPSLSFEFDNGTTGINVINAEDINSDSNNQIYDLSGRRVTNPTRGIFIKNGKKYVIK